MSNNINNIPCLESAELQEEWVEEEKIPVKKDTPVQKPPEEKKEEQKEGAKEGEQTQEEKKEDKPAE